MALYAPIIDTRVPGFSTAGPITIRFTHNRAVDQNSISHMRVLIKPYNSVQAANACEGQINWTEQTVTIEKQVLNEAKIALILGQYYHIQIAYCDNEGNIGPYSALGVGRCAASMDTSITVDNAGYRRTYTATYSYNSLLSNEPVAYYRFKFIERATNTLLEDSGWLTALNDLSYSPKADITTPTNITCSIITINGYEQTSPALYVKAKLTITDNDAVVCKQDLQGIENGYITIDFSGSEDPLQGDLKRCIEGQNNWETIGYVDTNENSKYYDFTIAQGQSYQYALYLIRGSTDVYGEKQLLNNGQSITAEFEHMFLADEERQLRIAFNPQVSSFKENVLESKQNTIGGKYPYFFRNGQVAYKELALSGLISYHLDVDHFFVDPLNNLNIVENRVVTHASQDEKITPNPFQLTNNNFYQEREFKLEVLKWLNNGKPKYLRSPAEGNYVVRLTGVSLAPNATVGRMLHTFSATACEIADTWNDICNQPLCQGVVIND